MALLVAVAVLVGLGGWQRLWQSIGWRPDAGVPSSAEVEEEGGAPEASDGGDGVLDVDLRGDGVPPGTGVRRGRGAPVPIRPDETPTGALRVAVLDEAGLPLEVEHVVAERRGRSELLRRIGPAVEASEGDPLWGAVRYRADLPVGEWVVRARGPEVGELSSRVVVVEQRLVDAVLRCEGGVRLAGVVVDPEGRVLRDATVEVRAPLRGGLSGAEGETTTVRTKRTDAGGRFDFARLPEGRLWLFASTEAARTPAPGLACEGRDLNLRLEVVPLGKAAFALETYDGRPLPDEVRVMVGRVSRPAVTRVRHLRVRGGRVEVEGLSGDLDEIVVDVEGYAAAARRVTAAAGETIELGVVVVTAGHSIYGRLLSDGGGPVVGARLRAAGGRCRARSGSTGEFLLTGVPEGQVGLLIEAEGHEAHEQTVEVTASAASAGQEGRVLVVLLHRVASVAGVVVGADGAPAEALRVAFVPVGDDDARPGAGRAEAATRTDEDGSFELDLAPGRYRVYAHEPPGAPVLLGEVVAARGETARLRLSLPR